MGRVAVEVRRPPKWPLSQLRHPEAVGQGSTPFQSSVPVSSGYVSGRSSDTLENGKSRARRRKSVAYSTSRSMPCFRTLDSSWISDPKVLANAVATTRAKNTDCAVRNPGETAAQNPLESCVSKSKKRTSAEAKLVAITSKSLRPRGPIGARDLIESSRGSLVLRSLNSLTIAAVIIDGFAVNATGTWKL
jgi:hypothetical protein